MESIDLTNDTHIPRNWTKSHSYLKHRSGHECCNLDGRMYCIGGYNEATMTDNGVKHLKRNEWFEPTEVHTWQNARKRNGDWSALALRSALVALTVPPRLPTQPIQLPLGVIRIIASSLQGWGTAHEAAARGIRGSVHEKTHIRCRWLRRQGVWIPEKHGAI